MKGNATIPVVRPNKFERSFVVDVDPQLAWERVTRKAPPAPDGRQQYDVPGFEALCSEIESEPGRFLRLKKEEEPCKGTEVVIALEQEGTGTRMTVVQSGFGPWLPDVFEMFGYVWNWIIADLMLFVERGINLRTHLFGGPPPTATLGCTTQEHLTGLIVSTVDDQGLCRRVGIAEGDLLLQLNSVRLVNGMLLGSLLHMAKPGDDVEITWAHGAEVHTATGQL